jgi:hypothetical protein
VQELTGVGGWNFTVPAILVTDEDQSFVGDTSGEIWINLDVSNIRIYDGNGNDVTSQVTLTEVNLDGIAGNESIRISDMKRGGPGNAATSTQAPPSQ